MASSYFVFFSFAFLLCTASFVAGQVEICEHDHFDVKTLKRQPEWIFRVNDPKMCVGGEANVQGECYGAFSICAPLPAGSCGQNSQAGFCQTVKDANIDTYYDTGKPNLVINEEAGTDGFQIAYYRGNTTSTCNSTNGTTTILFFTCDETAEWNVYDKNVTRFVTSFLTDPIDACLFVVTLNYSGACINQKPIFPEPCQVEGYDLSLLQQPLAWIAQESTHCYGVSVPGSTCELLFSFCKQLPLGQCYKSVFCQLGIPTGPTYSFGEYNDKLHVTENEDKSGFTISNFDGTQTSNCPNGLISTLVFVCDNTTDWTINDETGINNITRYATAEPMKNDCEFIVRFNFSGACYSGSFPPPDIPGARSGNKQSPVGWILIGIFFGAIIIYLAVGVTIQAVRGKRGVEMVPNHELWRAVIVYILEGCRATMDVVTCYTLRNKKIGISRKTDYESL